MGILPDDVLALFAGFSPSIGHARRMLKIVRAEVYRQIRLFRIHLGVQLHNSLESSVAGFQLRRYLQLAGQVTDVLWVPQLRYLRERVTRVSRKAKGKVHVPEGLQLPDDVIQVLELGPKFGVQSQRTNPELLTVVRQVSRNATEETGDLVLAKNIAYQHGAMSMTMSDVVIHKGSAVVVRGARRK
ncbi:hypothetical protein HPB50_008011 [Hyalomma asiaticum]|uniref:Uncharacterized protein n=1 Tax=Hyalomma asiaticum TaxID=266040 RepID=A0ACB7SD02_HYAAI|nr:hypothetical protein HPB50_008011 [Hyalomma asiaticum]